MNDSAKIVKILSDLTKNIKGLNNLQLLTACYTTTIIMVAALIKEHHGAKMLEMEYEHEERILQMELEHEEKMAEIKANLLSRAEERKNEKDN